MKKTKRFVVMLLVLCMLVQMLPVAAFEFEVPEAAEEIVEKADNAALSDEETIATYDDTYGQLLFYSGFNTENSLANEIEEESPVKGLKAIGGGSATVDGRTAIVAKSGMFASSKHFGTGVTSSDGNEWKYSDGTVVIGQFYLFADYYFDVNEVTKGELFVRFAPSQTSGDDLYGLSTKTGKQWLTTKSFLDIKAAGDLGQFNHCKRTNGVKKIEIGHFDEGDTEKLYFDNLKVYVQPDNALWLASDSTGANRTLAAISGDAYTFPTDFNGKAVSKWAVGANLYAAGETVEKSAIAAKTAYPFEYPETYDETYGQLVFYSGFHLSDAPFVNEIEELSPIKGLTVMQNTYNGIAVVGGRTAFSAKGGAFGNGGYAGIGITSSDGQLWKYEDGTVVTGRVVAFTDYYYDIAESEDFNKKDSLFVRYTPSDDSIYGLSEAKKSEWLTTRTPESYMAAGDGGAYERFNRKTGLSSFTIGRSGNADKLHFDNIKVYVKPNNALWLVDAEGGNRTFEVVSAETYTFPAAFNGVNVRTWKNGDTTYKAGEAVALADVAGKTWTVGATTDVAFADAVSVRTSGTPGIRFKATLDLATRADENFAEIGFMATRDTHYTNAFDASADSFILANANAANAKLCTVVRKSGSDLNSYLTEGNGELNFNALVVGVPEKAAYLTENLHLRAFVVCGGVTYYSAVKTDSVYGAVKRVSADPNYENDPYIQKIIELCETTNG